MTERQTLTVEVYGKAFTFTKEREGWSNDRPIASAEIANSPLLWATLDALLSMQTERDQAVKDVRWLLDLRERPPAPATREFLERLNAICSRYPQEKAL